MRIPREYRQLTIVTDTREQWPLTFAAPTVRQTLAVGDYSFFAGEEFAVVERKSLPDLVACCGAERKRFEKCVQRLLELPQRLLVVESD